MGLGDRDIDGESGLVHAAICVGDGGVTAESNARILCQYGHQYRTVDCRGDAIRTRRDCGLVLRFRKLGNPSVRDHFESGGGLDEWENNGYNIEKSVRELWNGERDVNKLISGVSIESAQIIQRILMHAISFDVQIRDLEEDDNTKSKHA